MQQQSIIEILTNVLDDEPLVLNFIEIALQNAGFTNYKLYSELKLLLSELDYRGQICVLDIDLKDGGTGIDAMRAIKGINPACHFIFMSSVASKAQLKELLNEGGVNGFVEKGDPNWLEDLVVLITKSAIAVDNELRASIELTQEAQNLLKLLE